MNIRVYPTFFQGTVTLPSSKSWGHRALMLASLAQGTSVIRGLTPSEDIDATRICLTALGATFQGETITGPVTFPTRTTLDAQASGSTLRMLLPLTLVSNQSYRWIGKDRLALRSLAPLAKLCAEQGIQFIPSSHDAWLPLDVQGPLKPGNYVIEGGTTSQFISGLLMILPLLPGPSQLTLTGTIHSRPYIEMTLAMMKKFGVEVTANWPTFLIQGHQRYRPQTLQAESDASHAAFFSLGASLRGDVMLEGEWSSLTQGDLILFSWLRSHHGNLVNTSRGYHVTQSSLQPMHVDLGNYPDLAPMLIASSAFIDGSSTFTSLARLNDKESPRFDVIKHLLTQWHVPFVATEDAITVHGSIHHRIPIGVYDTHRDHRMAMTLAMVSPFAEQSFVIQGMDCVRKSFPHFLDVYQAIGGRYEKE